jgi:hypothetical protein
LAFTEDVCFVSDNRSEAKVRDARMAGAVYENV